MVFHGGLSGVWCILFDFTVDLSLKLRFSDQLKAFYTTWVLVAWRLTTSASH